MPRSFSPSISARYILYINPIMRERMLAAESMRVPFMILLLSLFFINFSVFTAEFIKIPRF